jgi:putative spermidine/putrescine transport system substrate-binding protein
LAGDALTVTSWGGAYSKSQIEAYQKPYAAKTGITINAADYNGGMAEIRSQVQTGSVSWDVVDVERQDLMAGCDEGLFEIVDPSTYPPAPDGTPAIKDFLPGALTECGAGTIVWSTIIAYDKTKFPGDKPSKLADFFDLKKFPGVRALKKSPVANLEFALMADGVPPEKVYDVLSTKEGVERAFAKLDTIKDSLIWWDAGAQPPQMLADGEAVMVSAYNGRIFNAQVKENKPFVIIWDGQHFNVDYYVIIKGTKNLKVAMDFVKFATDTQRGADQAKWISYGPARKSSVPLISTYVGTDINMGPHMPTAPENFKTAIPNNAEWWADNQDEMIKRLNVWMAK